jgi:hypothetical protein
MKRTNHAQFVGIGQDVLPFVDKRGVYGAVYTKKDLIDAQLRGVPVKISEGMNKRSRRLNNEIVARLEGEK